ncbi:MAG: 50S ribosomal protein L11 methyltransferase [Tissierellia bacterium]|nr:50S ribosomal protein L11 methyltransferase [Tissierellia bacterium]
MDWLELKIYTDDEKFEAIENFLYENEIYSFEIVDPNLVNEEKQNEYDWNFVDEEIFKDAYDGIEIRIYASEESGISFGEIKEYIEENELGSFETDKINEENWANNWKKYYHVTHLGENIVIKPTWEEYDAKEKEIVIELDPGMAFGTGDHATTSMCLVEMEKYIKDGDLVYDIGCGSGILSIAAEKLGADKVIGVDLDPMCIKVSNENAELNKTTKTHFILGDLFDHIDGKANVIVANIIAEVIISFIEDLSDFIEDDGKIILSGIILEKEVSVVEELERNRYNIISVIRENGWVCITAEKR